MPHRCRAEPAARPRSRRCPSCWPSPPTCNRIALMDGNLDRPAMTGGASIYPFCWSILLAARGAWAGRRDDDVPVTRRAGGRPAAGPARRPRAGRHDLPRPSARTSRPSCAATPSSRSPRSTDSTEPSFDGMTPDPVRPRRAARARLGGRRAHHARCSSSATTATRCELQGRRADRRAGGHGVVPPSILDDDRASSAT